MSEIGEILGSLHCAALSALKGAYAEVPEKFGVHNWFRYFNKSSSIRNLDKLTSYLDAHDYISSEHFEALADSFESLLKAVLQQYADSEVRFMLDSMTAILESPDLATLSYGASTNYIDKFATADIIIHIEPLFVHVLDMSNEEFSRIFDAYLHLYDEVADNELYLKGDYILTPDEMLAELKYIISYEVRVQAMFNTPLGIALAQYVDID